MKLKKLHCDHCGRLVEVHLEGWFYDHTRNGEMDDELCPGSGARPGQRLTIFKEKS
jgi:hypothetical protein